jgi:hypothetical protein
MTDLDKKLLQERLDCINQIKIRLNETIFDLQKFCMHCNEDRIYCKLCTIPLTRKKIESVFL